MRSGAWLCAGSIIGSRAWRKWLGTCSLLLAAAIGACSGGYPLEPTPCDDWCHATQGGYAYCGGYYDPASCVSQCEEDGSGRPECSAQLEAATNCYRSDPAALSAQCDYDFDPNAPPEHCQLEAAALSLCAGQYWQGGPGVTEVPSQGPEPQE